MLYEVLKTIVHDGAIKSEGSTIELTEGEALRYIGNIQPLEEKAEESDPPTEPVEDAQSEPVEDTVTVMTEADLPQEPKQNKKKIRGFKKRKIR